MSYPIPKNLNKPILRNVFRYIHEKKGNCLVGITGRVITGKSWTAVFLGLKFDKKFDVEESLVYTVEQLIDQSLKFIKVKGKPLTFERIKDIKDIDQWLLDNIKRIKIKAGKVIIFDEAGSGAYVREFFSQDNKAISKLIQIWRFLRLLVIIVVPEDLRLAESTISKFLNIEILMKGIKKRGAECVAWEYIGWDKRKKEPFKKRLKGCRGIGYIYISPLPDDVAEKYEELSRVYKMKAMIDLGKQYKIQRMDAIGKSRTLWDDIEYVKEHKEEFINGGELKTAPKNISPKLNGRKKK